MAELNSKAPLRVMYRAFREAPTPELSGLVGTHKAVFAGPVWLRMAEPVAMRLTGMPAWWGKRFRATAAGGDSLEGENLLRRQGRLVESIPMRAQIAQSRVDGRPALVISYPPDARWPHRLVNDELRPLDENTLLGLSFGIPLAPRGGAPFILHRRDEVQ